jgi:hypothetical protein
MASQVALFRETAGIDVTAAINHMRPACGLAHDGVAQPLESSMTKDWTEWTPRPHVWPSAKILDAERRADGVYVTRSAPRTPAWLPFAVCGLAVLILWRFKLVALLLLAWALAGTDHPLAVMMAITFLAFVAIYQRRKHPQF